jgi:lipoprotein NlpI
LKRPLCGRPEITLDIQNMKREKDMNLAGWLLIGCIGVAAMDASAAEQTPTTQEYQDMSRCENAGKSITPDLAIASCTKVIDSKKWTGANLARAYVARGIAYEDKQDFDHAIANYTQAIEFDPKEPRNYNNRCFAHNNKNELDLAIADCNQAILLDPKFSRAYINRGVAYYHKQDYAHAIADYNQAIEIDSKYAPAFEKRGIAYDDNKDYDHAISDYKQAIELDRRSAYSAIWLFVASTRSGKSAHADLEANAARINHTEWPYPIIEMFLGNKTPEDILSAATNPNSRCEAQLYVGEWQLLQKDPGKAAPFLHKASETCPKDFVEYSRALAELKSMKN